MIPGMTGAMSMVASAPNATITKTDNDANSTDTNVYTFTSKSIGTAASGRRIIVGVSGVMSPAVTISSLTVGGNAATQVVNLAQEGNLSPVSLYIIQVDTGTTATVVVTFSGSALCCGIGVWAAYNLLSSTPTATFTATGDPASSTINISAGGVCAGYGGSYGGAGITHVWTGITEDFDQVVDSGISVFQTGASLAFAAAQTGLTVSCDRTNGTNTGIAVASFR